MVILSGPALGLPFLFFRLYEKKGKDYGLDIIKTC